MAVVTYFLLNEQTGRLKIGKSTQFETRRRDLEHMGGAPLRLIGTVDRDCEREWHARLKAFRVHGEWFTLTPVVAETIRTHYGWRLRSPKEPPPRPTVTLGDFRHDLEARSGLGLRTPVDAFTLEETLLDLVDHDIILDDVDDEADRAEPADPAEDDETALADPEEAIGLIVERIETWRAHWIGWMAPATPPAARWIDVWFVFWAPRGEESRRRLRRDMLCAAQYSDYDDVDRLRLRPVLVDPETAAREELTPNELYSNEALWLFLQIEEHGG